jgi:hypothetical protein
MSDKPAINTNVRLFDLVRYSRAELHHEGLITDEEYAWLCANAPMATSAKGGSPSRERIEDYDEIRATVARLEAEKRGLEEAIGNMKPLLNRYHYATLEMVEASNGGDLDVIGKAADKLREVCIDAQPILESPARSQKGAA